MESKKPLTEVEPFNFNTEQRAEVHKTKEPPHNEVCTVTVIVNTYGLLTKLVSVKMAGY